MHHAAPEILTEIQFQERWIANEAAKIVGAQPGRETVDAFISCHTGGVPYIQTNGKRLVTPIVKKWMVMLDGAYVKNGNDRARFNTLEEAQHYYRIAKRVGDVSATLVDSVKAYARAAA